jgi:hypothetical protein
MRFGCFIRFLFYNLFRLITLKAAFMAKLVAAFFTFLSFLLFAFLEKISVGGLTKVAFLLFFRNYTDYTFVFKF